MQNRLNKAVIPFLVFSVLALLFAMWGGLLNEAAILLFLAVTVSSVIGSVRRSAFSS